jgi:hypothetical protein
MKYTTLSGRPLTSEEFEFFWCQDLGCGKGPLHRWHHQVVSLTTIAFLAAASACLPASPAEAQINDLVRAVVQGGIALGNRIVGQENTEQAQSDLTKQSSVRERQPVSKTIVSEELGITDQELAYINLAPGIVQAMTASGVEARNDGPNADISEATIDAAKGSVTAFEPDRHAEEAGGLQQWRLNDGLNDARAKAASVAIETCALGLTVATPLPSSLVLSGPRRQFVCRMTTDYERTKFFGGRVGEIHFPRRKSANASRLETHR